MLQVRANKSFQLHFNFPMKLLVLHLSLDLFVLVVYICICQVAVSSSNEKKTPNFLQHLHENLPTHLKNRHQRHHHIRVESGGISDPLEGLTAINMPVVNGLNNSDVSFLIISSWFENGRLFRERTIPAMRTWMRMAANVFVIIEDTVDARLAFRHCHYNEHIGMTAFHCHNEPIVLMTRVCSANPSTSDGICCKMDELIRYLTAFRKDIYAHTKYVLFADDDSYFRVDIVLRWLSYIEHANISHIPLIANTNSGESNSRGCQAVETYGWYGQTMLNKAALDKYISVPNQYPLTEVCKAWSIAQDIALGIFGWMLELSNINLPGYESIDLNLRTQNIQPIDHAYYLDRAMIFHHVFSSENNGYWPCDTTKWPPSLRYNQEDMTGCGSLYSELPDVKFSHRGLSCYQLWKYYAVHGTDEVPIKHDNRRYVMETGKEPIPKLLLLHGYNKTNHYESFHPHLNTNGVLTYPESWKVFGRSDCKAFHPPPK